jgi:hypothetical protein
MHYPPRLLATTPVVGFSRLTGSIGMPGCPPASQILCLANLGPADLRAGPRFGAKRPQHRIRSHRRGHSKWFWLRL